MALIGIILLIGIVKKNTIMMIDFALAAERNEAKPAHDAHLPGVPAALPPDHDDDHGGIVRHRAIGDRPWRGRGTAPAAWHRNRRRPDPHPLHDAGHLHLCRPLQSLVRAIAFTGTVSPATNRASWGVSPPSITSCQLSVPLPCRATEHPYIDFAGHDPPAMTGSSRRDGADCPRSESDNLPLSR
jgi:hypothetical protein